MQNPLGYTYFDSSKYPLSKIFIPFSLGIIFGDDIHILLLYTLFILSSLMLLGYKKLKTLIWLGFLMISSFSFGGLWTTIRNPLNSPEHFSHFLKENEKSLYLITIEDEGNSKPNSILYEAKILALSNNDARWMPVKGSLPLYFITDSSQYLTYGDTLIIKNYLNPFVKPATPYHFDYAEFMAKKGYSHQAFLRSNQIVQHFPSKTADPLIYKARKKIKDALHQHVDDLTARSLMSAVLINDRTEMAEDLRLHFSKTGISHIIAISGMHVSILCSFLLFFIPYLRLNWARYVLYSLSLILVWSYIAITHFPPSAIRAATMFSLGIIGVFIQRKSYSVNNLIITGLLMLLYNPLWIWDVGFQLSFLAVLSILCFNPTIANLWKPKRKITQYVWSIIAISTSVQILVFPLILYYFNSFPLFVLIANIPAVMYSFILLSFSFLLIIFHLFFPFIAEVIGSILSKITHVFYTFVTWLSDHTPTLFQKFSISSVQLFLLYVLIFSVIYSIQQKRFKSWYISYISLSLFYINVWNAQKYHHSLSFIYAFQENKKDFILLKSQEKSYLISDSSLSPKGFEYQIAPLIIGHKISNFDTLFNQHWQDIKLGSIHIEKNKSTHKNSLVFVDNSHLNILHNSISPKVYILNSNVPWYTIDSLNNIKPPNSILHSLGVAPFYSLFKNSSGGNNTNPSL